MPVPIDWSDRTGATIDIAVIRDKADDPARRIGTLVSLPGGPGGSGVDQILGENQFSAELRARFDIVSLDPRGVKRSSPVRCDAGLAEHFPNMVPDAGGRIDEVHAYAKELAASCRQYTGPLIDHVDAVSVARDVEALRAALGEDRIDIYSRSYGTMPAQAYAELFPKRVRTMVLDSVDDHSLDGAGFLASESRAAQDTFDEFAAWCARDTACVLHGADLNRTFGALYERAARGELRDPASPDKSLGALDLSTFTIKRLYAPEWQRLATDLQALTGQPAAAPIAQEPPKASGRPVPMAAIIVCSDWRFDIPDQDRWTRLWREQNANSPTLRAHFAWAAGTVCSGWPIAAPNPPHRPAVEGAPPILIVNGKHDPATPHEWARAVAANTSGAILLTYDGWGHGAYDRTPCTITAVDTYITSRTVPAVTNCPAA
ncbi:alpha/beta hydrolase [Nocardia sp. NPDC052566]|uniref:alpha/beta hydrolase n=1 Tax=Nocardia sp. NPDC052566 TaxID=3364330 RepID=UPI0037CA4A4B